MGKYVLSKPKIRINRLFAFTVQRSFKSRRNIKIAVLDTKIGFTINTLNKYGVPLQNIYVPNKCKKETKEIQKLGVNAFEGTAETFLEHTDTKFRVLWYDGMTTLNGNKSGCKPCVASDLFLRKTSARSKIGSTCILALTIMTRNNQTEYNVGKQKDLTQRQLRAIIGRNGFVIQKEKIENYQRNCCFGMWVLEYDPANSKRPDFVYSTQGDVIGFPKNYNISHLQ